MIKKSAYLGVVILFITAIISCEKDFTDIASNVVTNSKFDTKDTIIEIVVTNKAITNVRADGLAIGGTLGQYLLGVYNNPNYEKIEASIISQLAIDASVNVADKTYGTDTTVVTTIDTVFLKLPYQATLKADTTAEYDLDSIIGDPTKAFNFNLYRTDSYMNRLDPNDPSKTNKYLSNHAYQIIPGELNAQVDYQFKPDAKDTLMVYKRRLSNGLVYQSDTLRLTNNNPFARIPLDEAKIKTLFVDQYGTANFETQEAINEYIKGLYLEAKGNEGALIGFNITSTDATLRPSLEIRYTNTILKNGSIVVDTIMKSNSFLLSNFSTGLYKMEEKTYPNDNNIVVQGAAGNMAQIEMLTGTQLNDLRSKNWLINEASLTFYVNQNIVDFDTIQTPNKLFLFKDGVVASQIKDHISEGPTVYDGNLILTENKPDYYKFRITDYLSDLLLGNSSYNPKLGLKVFNNPTDGYSSLVDTLVTNYSWNPKTVTLLNHNKVANGERRARLKISYSIKK